MYVDVRVCVCVCVCFPNWIGIVVEVKRGQLKRERERRREGRGEEKGGWMQRKSWQGIRGFRRAAVPYFKDGLQSGQTLTPLAYHR